MSRFATYFFGPELYWLLVCLLVRFKAQPHSPANPAITSYLDDHWAWLPFIFVPLSFVCFLVAGPSRWWLLLRVDLSMAIGLMVTATVFANAMTYHDPKTGPGAGTAFLVIPMLGAVVATLGTAVAAVVIWWKQRA